MNATQESVLKKGMKRFFLMQLFLVVFPFLLLRTGPAQAEAENGNGKVVRATLENGLRVVIVRNTLAPVVTTEINYLAGSNEAPEGFPGMAHALEHMMFRGSAGLSAAQLSAIIAAMGGNFDADTQQTVTQYFFTVPSDDLDIALRIEAIRMQNLLNSRKLWEQERGAIEQEVAQDLSNPEYIFYTRLIKKMFAGTPYAEDALGSRPSFQKTTSEMLKKFYKTWYAPNNAILVIVGDVDPEQALAKVKRLFEKIPSHTLPQRPAVQFQPISPGSITLETDQPYGLAMVAYRMPGFDSPDFAAAQVLVDVLDSQRGNLYELAPQGKALEAGFNWNPLPKAASGYAMAAFPQGGDGAALISAIKAIISGYLKNGIPPDLVEAAKRREITEAELQKNSVSGLAAAWSQALAVEGRNSPEDDINAIKKVRVEDVNQAARKYLIEKNMITAILTPRPSGSPVVAKGFRGKESFASKYTKPAKLPGWAKKAVAPPAIPSSHVNPVDMKLPNGLRLIIQPESISPTIGIYGQVRSNPGLEEPQGKEGVNTILNALFPYGTTTLDRIAFQTALDDIGADASVGTTFSLSVLADHFERGVQLLSGNILDPALPEPAFKVVQKETAATLTGLLQSADYLARHSLRLSLYPKGDPATRQATPETVNALTMHDVRDYYRTVFRPDLTTIVVIGKIDPKEAKNIIEKYFGPWQASGPKPRTDPRPVPLNKPSVSVVPDKSRVQDNVILAQTLGLTRSHPDYYKLQLGNNVLSGAFYATRLYRDLREEAGLVYAVESFFDVKKTRGLFGVFYACDPENVWKARGLVARDLREMQKKPVPPYELQRAKALLLRRIPLKESSTESIASLLLSFSVEDLPLDEPLRAARHYLNITAAQVRAAFAKWIRPAGFVQVIQGPLPK